MASRMTEADSRPLSPPAGSCLPVTATALPQICCKLVINVTGALTTFSMRTLDGSAIALGALPVGVWTFDVQFDMVTWTGGTVGGIVAFFRQP